MALSANLQLRQSQSLVMTPQLMQSIRLLQFGHAQLQSFIEQEVERNPLLELAEGGSDGEPAGKGFDGPLTTELQQERAHSDKGPDGLPDGRDERAESPLDIDLGNVFPDETSSIEAPQLVASWKSMPGASSNRAAGEPDMDHFAAASPSLRDIVGEQIVFAFSDDRDRLIASELADHLDAAGYLDGNPLEIALRLGVAPARVDDVLLRLQELDPPGLFARSLSDCLRLQLQRKNRLDPAMETLLEHLDLLARRDFTALSRLCGVGEDDLLDMLAEIRALDPKPGSRYETGQSVLVVPEVIVRAAGDGSWAVELNPDALPRVLVDHAYCARVSAHLSPADKERDFLNECLQTANWLTRALDQRARTIIKVASEIVRHQDAFLLHGIDRLRPLNLKTVAEAIGMHESTVSRVTSNKFMMTPRGLFELKYFFTAAIASHDEGGETHSAAAVRHRIRTLVDAEDPFAVLSDDDLVRRLKEDGIAIARRTVAKYRDALSIPSSVQRRREKRARARAASAINS
ncbi:RNA polymerase factor sigma-54 [Pseudohoeflea coraliihabitans]|uniref:RNA polymerase sigma-54 factor n=1 Tax=Pseudohoeflea coraliihabitans TaxID=2860393 RepID=A0ABS6WRB5_9HYPH|nr:RNA polymerase factor sigma-54 [Pseudohoeflea sp. DP4N28-3]MBW3097590.1 RNA polymerase factor sigma-54 [Pseudohoeflea sp. DP4N28-3]